MKTSTTQCNSKPNFLRRLKSLAPGCCKGQAMVEFTLVFFLLLLVAWIPADFGLAFYTSQLAQNASREGARIAAADPNLANPTATSCGPPITPCYGSGNILKETAVRLPAALMGSTTTINVDYPVAGSTACDNLVRVTVQGQYPFFFYKLLRFLGINVTVPTINRQTTMRWEHQTACPSF